jgi:exodeoxyribonuclease V alpha subunit
VADKFDGLEAFDAATPAPPAADPPPAGPVELAGEVDTLYARKPTFSAGVLRVGHRRVKFRCKGYVRGAGESVVLRGKWTTDPKWGRQFAADSVVYAEPADPAGLARWLALHVAGLGPQKSQALADEFGMDLPRLVAADPQQVAVAGRLPIEAVHRIADVWHKYGEEIRCVSALLALGLTQRQADALFDRFKGSAVTIMKDDPYLTVNQVTGFGFKTVDEIALGKLGLPKTFPGRWRGALVSAVHAAERDDGSTAIPEPLAVSKACEVLGVPEEDHHETLAGHARAAADLGHVTRVAGAKGEFHLGPPAAYRHEAVVWQILQTARRPNPHIGRAKAGATAAMYATVGGVTLDADQLAAVEAVAANRIAFVTGGAGSGKTSLVKAIHKMFRDADVSVALCAPTGKAADRMAEAVGAEAKTIHRLLGCGPTGFRAGPDSPLLCGVVVCDELSMVSSSLLYHLLRALGPYTAFVGIGDANQLPPVEAGAVLRDAMAHDIAPVARLTKCHRQAGPLKLNSAAVLDGVVEPTVTDVSPSPWMVNYQGTTPERVWQGVEVLFDKYLPQWGYDPVTETQFLTAQKKGKLGTVHLNRLCQYLRQRAMGVDVSPPVFRPDGKDDPDEADAPDAGLMVGDKVLHTRNNYKIEVMNGSLGVVLGVAPDLVVRYRDKDVVYPAEYRGEVTLGYVLTVHKYQGSQSPCAVTICHRLNGFMQHRSWLYTAVTRAQKTSVIVGDDDGIRRAAERRVDDRRGTWLQVFAKHEAARPQARGND